MLINNCLNLNLQFSTRYCINQLKYFKYKKPYTNFIRYLNKSYSKRMEGDINVRLLPIVTKLETLEFKSIFTTDLKDLLSLFKKYDYELRIAGGAVRDLIMNKKPIDIDFATTATPDQIKIMFNTENIRMINMRGEKHGTITARINDENFEITTLRIDVTTDGRHAEVEFTKNWMLDANRRDLTINSMFLGFDGCVYDYFYGYDDLMKRRVAFVGNAEQRIREDYLRILRYFRFYGRIAEEINKHDESTLNAIRVNVNGLERISGERIWGELRKILLGNFYDHLLTVMLKCGCSKYIGLPEDINYVEFERVTQNNIKFDKTMNPITLLVAFLNTSDDVLKLHNRLKFSAYDRDLAIFLTKNKEDTKDINDIRLYQKMCFDTIGRPTLMKEYVEELLKYNNKIDIYNEFKNWKIPNFSVSGNLLQENGCPSGNIMGIVLKKLRAIWIDSYFQMSSKELLNELPNIYNELNIVDGKVIKKHKCK